MVLASAALRCLRLRVRARRGRRLLVGGAYLLNFITTEVVFAGLLLAVLIATWPSPPWSRLIWMGAVQMIVTPIAFYPFSKALWLGGDLVFRPPTAADFAARGDAGEDRRD